MDLLTILPENENENNQDIENPLNQDIIDLNPNPIINFKKKDKKEIIVNKYIEYCNNNNLECSNYDEINKCFTKKDIIDRFDIIQNGGDYKLSKKEVEKLIPNKKTVFTNHKHLEKSKNSKYTGIDSENLYNIERNIFKITDLFTSNIDFKESIEDMEINKDDYINSLNGTLEKYPFIKNFVDPLMYHCFVVMNSTAHAKKIKVKKNIEIKKRPKSIKNSILDSRKSFKNKINNPGVLNLANITNNSNKNNRILKGKTK